MYERGSTQTSQTSDEWREWLRRLTSDEAAFQRELDDGGEGPVIEKLRASRQLLAEQSDAREDDILLARCARRLASLTDRSASKRVRQAATHLEGAPEGHPSENALREVEWLQPAERPRALWCLIAHEAQACREGKRQTSDALAALITALKAYEATDIDSQVGAHLAFHICTDALSFAPEIDVSPLLERTAGNALDSLGVFLDRANDDWVDCGPLRAALREQLRLASKLPERPHPRLESAWYCYYPPLRIERREAIELCALPFAVAVIGSTFVEKHLLPAAIRLWESDDECLDMVDRLVSTETADGRMDLLVAAADIARTAGRQRLAEPLWQRLRELTPKAAAELAKYGDGPPILKNAVLKALGSAVRVGLASTQSDPLTILALEALGDPRARTDAFLGALRHLAGEERAARAPAATVSDEDDPLFVGSPVSRWHRLARTGFSGVWRVKVLASLSATMSGLGLSRHARVFCMAAETEAEALRADFEVCVSCHYLAVATGRTQGLRAALETLDKASGLPVQYRTFPVCGLAYLAAGTPEEDLRESAFEQLKSRILTIEDGFQRGLCCAWSLAVISRSPAYDGQVVHCAALAELGASADPAKWLEQLQTEVIFADDSIHTGEQLAWHNVDPEVIRVVSGPSWDPSEGPLADALAKATVRCTAIGDLPKLCRSRLEDASGDPASLADEARILFDVEDPTRRELLRKEVARWLSSFRGWGEALPDQALNGWDARPIAELLRMAHEGWQESDRLWADRLYQGAQLWLKLANAQPRDGFPLLLGNLTSLAADSGHGALLEDFCAMLPHVENARIGWRAAQDLAARARDRDRGALVLKILTSSVESGDSVQAARQRVKWLLRVAEGMASTKQRAKRDEALDAAARAARATKEKKARTDLECQLLVRRFALGSRTKWSALSHTVAGWGELDVAQDLLPLLRVVSACEPSDQRTAAIETIASLAVEYVAAPSKVELAWHFHQIGCNEHCGRLVREAALLVAHSALVAFDHDTGRLLERAVALHRAACGKEENERLVREIRSSTGRDYYEPPDDHEMLLASCVQAETGRFFKVGYLKPDPAILDVPAGDDDDPEAWLKQILEAKDENHHSESLGKLFAHTLRSGSRRRQRRLIEQLVDRYGDPPADIRIRGVAGYQYRCRRHNLRLTLMAALRYGAAISDDILCALVQRCIDVDLGDEALRDLARAGRMTAGERVALAGEDAERFVRWLEILSESDDALEAIRRMVRASSQESTVADACARALGVAHLRLGNTEKGLKILSECGCFPPAEVVS